MTSRGCRVGLVDARKEDDGEEVGESDNKKEIQAKIQALTLTSQRGACLLILRIQGRNNRHQPPRDPSSTVHAAFNNGSDALAPFGNIVSAVQSQGKRNCTRQ